MTTFTAPAATTLSYADLTQRLWNPELAALLPQPGEKGAEFSSYDRASRLNPETGHYENWGANEDQMGRPAHGRRELGFRRDEGPRLHLAHLVRRAGRRACEGHHRRQTGDRSAFKSYFDGKTAPFNRPNLVYTAARGENNYTPIPYRHSCKIIGLPNWGGFYQVSYTTFPHGTKVPSFSMDGGDNAALDEANAKLGARGECPFLARMNDKAVSQTVNIAPGPDGVRGATGWSARHHGISRKACESPRVARRPEAAARPRDQDYVGRRRAARGLGAVRRFLWHSSRCEPVPIIDERPQG